MYLGAEHLIGFLTVVPSAQWYSYLRPADMTGQESSVQNSVIVPYNMLIWLKKSTATYVTHTFQFFFTVTLMISFKLSCLIHY